VAEDEPVEVGAELAVIDDGTGAPAAAPAPAAGAAAGASGTDVVLPALGESVTEGTVTRWLKQVGEEVAEDEPLLEVSTDKVDTEIPSPVAGVLLEILVGEDETAEVGAKLAVVGAPGAAPAAAPAPAAPAPAPGRRGPGQPPERHPGRRRRRAWRRPRRS
ncbi:biotin/lipoyl-containing protein, partial [Streptomyces sp. MBT65]|uniref:biotin/lipoyl-containing protein n=1 Tax=Streptomyces sp. MBT65 TaxID=1488395 RepID=UPI0027DA1853